MTTYVHTNASEADLLDPALNPDVRIVKLDFRQGATVESVMVALAAEFPTDEYPPLRFRDTPLFAEIVSDWLRNNWNHKLHIQLLLRHRDCRDQVELLHDVAGAFNDAVEAAQFERMRLQQYEGVADAHARFVMRMYVFAHESTDAT